MSEIERLQVRCCICGGGPAGMMLGFLLARAGVDVLVLEKHGDFLRDFRGDTIHPSTLQVIHELGLLQEFLARPHQEVKHLRGYFGDSDLTVADFTRLPTKCKFLMFMPQWDFLDFLVQHARAYPTFQLRLNTEVTDLIEESGRIVGVRAKTPSGTLEVQAGLTVGADGRQSIVRERAGLKVLEVGAPMDVLWMRLSRRLDDPSLPAGRFDRGRIMVLIYRGEYWQAGFVIPKGGHEEIRRRGLEAFREDITQIAPFLHDRVQEMTSWDDVKLLTVKVDRLEHWHRPGLLCIGDSAHAMSPVGGVGINLAIQDAVAAANLLAPALRRGVPSLGVLSRVQNRREFPTRVTQWLQVQIQNRMIGQVLATKTQVAIPWPLRMIQRFPVLQRIPAWVVGIGVRPEHVHSPSHG